MIQSCPLLFSIYIFYKISNPVTIKIKKALFNGTYMKLLILFTFIFAVNFVYSCEEPVAGRRQKRSYYQTNIDTDPQDLRTYVPLREKQKLTFDIIHHFNLLLSHNLYEALHFLTTLCSDDKISIIKENQILLDLDQHDQNLLHYACFAGNTEIAGMLLHYFPQLASQLDVNSLTPLDLADHYEHEDIINLFQNQS